MPQKALLTGKKNPQCFSAFFFFFLLYFVPLSFSLTYACPQITQGSSVWGGEEQEPAVGQGSWGRLVSSHQAFPSAAAGGCGLAACLLLLPRESALSMAGFAAPEKEEGAFRGGDGAWLLQSKQGQWKKHGSFLEVCSSTPPIIVGGVIFQLFKSFERSASLSEYDLKEMMPS